MLTVLQAIEVMNYSCCPRLPTYWRVPDRPVTLLGPLLSSPRNYFDCNRLVLVVRLIYCKYVTL